MQIMEGNIATTIKNNLNNIGHIQLADNPGRHEPGTGEINYPWLLDYIDQLGYQGGLVANIYHPRPRWKVYAGSKRDAYLTYKDIYHEYWIYRH